MTRRYLWARCLQRALVIEHGKACYDWAAIRTRRSRHLCRKEWAMFEKPYHRPCGCASAVIKKSVHALIGCCLGNNQSHDMSESILFIFFLFFWGMLKNFSCCFHLTSMVHFWLVTKIKNFPFYFFFSCCPGRSRSRRGVVCTEALVALCGDFGHECQCQHLDWFG